MRYHEMKIRDAIKLSLIGAAGAAAFLVALIFRSEVELLVNRLPLRSNEPFVPLMAALAILILLCFGMAVWYLRTSPEQNAEYVNRARSKGRKIPDQFDWKLLDETDPHFRLSTWAYLRKRRGNVR
jgi:hypothetical protein